MKNSSLNVVMSVKNESKYLSQSIESILKQSYKNFKFLIVDDFGNRKVKSILKFYKKKDRRVKIIKNKKNIGLTKSLIKAINLSKSKFIARIDSDDYSHKDRLQKQINWISKSKKRVLCGTEYFQVKKNILIKKKLPNFHNDIKKNIIFRNCFVHSSTLFRLKAYKKVGGYNKNMKYAQDYDLWSRLIHTGEVGNIRENLTFSRTNYNSISNIFASKQTLNSIIISCNNYYFSKTRFFFTIDKNIKKNIYFIEKNPIISNFYYSIRFLNRKKLENKYYVNLSDLSLKSFKLCLKQPKMLIFSLLK
tara:strand:+ start:8 stop:922 length:915 start_codon:yes stop_codon:yes gene_type:complete